MVCRVRAIIMEEPRRNLNNAPLTLAKIVNKKTISHPHEMKIGFTLRISRI